MILNLYSLKNRLSGIYERPVAENCEVKDYIESLARTLASQPVDSLNFYKEFDAYFVGTFDTKSAVIAPADEFLGSLEGICLAFIGAKSGEKDVGQKVEG